MFVSFLQTLAIVAFVVKAAIAANPALGTYNIGQDITVSGLSSGGFMAVQTHVAFSKTIKGAAVFAGGPYWCAEGDVNTAQYVCMSQMMGQPDVKTYIDYTDKASAAGNIDATSNLADDQIYLFSGNVDSTVNPIVMKDLMSYYQNYLNTSTIATEWDVKAEHCIPTLNHGEPCDVKKSPYIGKCNYDGAGVALKWLYGDSLKSGGSAVSSHLTAFDQTKFFSGTGTSLDSTGYIYVPAGCADGTATCKLHIAFHGCKQDLKSIGNEYAAETGFNSWAEANNIIVLYPYTTTSVNPSNPNACWDWWGYTGKDYVYKSGKQMKFIKDLIDHLVGDGPVSTPTAEPVPSAQPVVVPTQPPVPTHLPTFKPTSGFVCSEWTACVWDHYTAGRAVFSESYTHYAAKGSLQDLGLTGYCGGAAGVTTPVAVKETSTNYYELGNC